MHILYHYVHCPFCIRVRLALGKLSLEWESKVLSYDDEKTPVDLAGKKMLPILSFPNGTTINESLDIIKKLDTQNIFQNELNVSNDGKILNELINEVSGPLFKLCMPYFIYTPEFSESSRNYFQKKKEAKRGPFHKLIQNKQQHLNELLPILEKIENEITDYFKSSQLTIMDIILASHLWGLYIFPEFQFSQKLHEYLQRVGHECKFDYHEDFWKQDKPIF